MNQPSFDKIPPDLVDSIAQGSCVLFLGADASYDTPEWSGPPSRGQLAAALAAKYDWVAPGQELRFAAEEFLGREPENLHGLISLVREQVAACTRPGPVHQLVVDLGFDAVVTNGYDTLLETAMQAAGRRMLQVVGDAEIAYAGGKEEAIIIHLAGAVDRPESLVLTDADQIRVENHLSEKLQAVRGWCTLRPLLFIGWDPEDDAFRRLYIAATEKLGGHKRRNYLVWPAPSLRASAFCKSYNVEIIPAQPLPFLRALAGLAQQKRALRPGYRPGEVVGKLPYKFLDYFDPGDRDIFCGREVEAPLVFRMALSYPLLTLFGQSGVGKTSLLRAGVVPLLVEEGYCYAYVRALGDPLRAIRQGVCGALSLPPTVESAGEGDALLDFFRRALGDGGRLMVILDQFEELFIRSGKSTRKQFWRELGACLGLANPEVRFILSLREDYLAELDEARRPLEEGTPPPVSDILRNSYRLTSLEADTAYLAIVEPARRARCRVEPELADLLLGRAEMPVGADLTPAGWSLAEADGTIPPPALQIVMDRLYRQALARAGHKPPLAGQADKAWEPPSLALTLDQYRALGGAGQILAEYVTDALDEVPRRGGDRQMAMTLLKVMVTGQKTKAALDEDELVVGLGEADPDFDPDDPQALACLRATRAALVNLRLVRSFKLGEGALYELAHDHMAAEIATWIGEEEMQAKLARELLGRELGSWRSPLRKLIEPAALRLIHAQREGLRRLAADELELLFRSALAAGYEVPYWFERARQGGVAVDEIALAGLQDTSFRVRAAAVATLSQLGARFAEPIMGMLADDYPRVRAAAIAALETLQPDGKWRERLACECYVPAGKFTMGEGKKAHEVSLDAFYIGKYPVTNADYELYMDDLGRAFQVPPGEADHPVVQVSWYAARDYAAWAGMRLPTEAQWEKAASWEPGPAGAGDEAGKKGRVGRKRRYPWGDEFDRSRCNTKEAGIRETTPVGKYSPRGDSPNGCADMVGNVFEWTSSLGKTYPYRAHDGREDMASSEFRVLRGGSFFENLGSASAAYRRDLDPNLRSGFCGFRVCLAAPFSPPLAADALRSGTLGTYKTITSDF